MERWDLGPEIYLKIEILGVRSDGSAYKYLRNRGILGSRGNVRVRIKLSLFQYQTNKLKAEKNLYGMSSRNGF